MGGWKVFVLLLALGWAGCSKPAVEVFSLNLEGREPKSVGLSQREAIEKALAGWFGSPVEPKLPASVNWPIEPIQRGAGLFRQHCIECHGVGGTGLGRKAASLTPYPRDYRNGIFKFTSTTMGAKPAFGDLQRTLRCGLPGTPMPSFAKLSDSDRDDAAHYVRFLSLRGESELFLIRLVVDEDEYLPLDLGRIEREGIAPIVGQWEKAESQIVAVGDAPDRPALVEEGRKIYQTKEAQCVKCHGPEGDGDGEEKELLDDWNKPKKGVTPERTKQLAALYSLPIQLLKPRNFQEGIYHGGDRDCDLYWRVHVGVKGTPMPAVGPTPGSQGVLTPDQIWAVVRFVRSKKR